MLSTQTTETTEAIQYMENPPEDFYSPVCEGYASPTPTPGDPILTTITTALSTTMGAPEINCKEAVNCTGIHNNPGATIASPLLLGLTGTIGQIWALVYLHCSTKRQNQRTVFYLLLCILIWTDFFGKILTTPTAIVSYAKGEWVGGERNCNFHGFSMVFISILTHFTVSAMAVERYLGICHGYFYSRNVTPSRCKMFFAGIWIFSLAISVLPLLGFGRLYRQYPGTWCFTNIHLCAETPLTQKIFTTGVGVLNVFNLLVIVVCNVFVVGSLLKMRITPDMGFQQGQPHRNRKKNEQELQMVIVLIIITCIFVISWAPLDVILVTNQAWLPHPKKEDHVLELWAIRLCSINQIVDPFAYIICRVVFRSRFWNCCRRAIMGRGWSRRGEGSHFQISSLLHNTRKFSRTQSPPKEHIATVKEVNQEFDEEAEIRAEKEKTTRAPSIHKSYYSDSGTGSYSGVETPLVDKLEESPFSPESLKETAIQEPAKESLVKSHSVGIPIPLFTSEQYRVAELGKDEADGQNRDIYCLVDGSYNLIKHRVSNPENNFHDMKGLINKNNGHIAKLTGTEEAGVYRSNSWGCQSIKPPQTQCRTQSTQTLSTGHGSFPLNKNSNLSPPTHHTVNMNDHLEPNGNTYTENATGQCLEPNGNITSLSSNTVLQTECSDGTSLENFDSIAKRRHSCLSDNGNDSIERATKPRKN